MAFGYYKSLTLDHTQCGSADSSNWPLAIGLGVGCQAADADLKTVGNGGYVQNANGYDIYFYSDAALTTRLPAERVFFDGANGYLEAHVKIPTLSHSSDVVIYMAFGDSSISTDPNTDGTYGTTSTWNANYLGVYHLTDPTSPVDATGTHNGTNSGTTAATGKLDGGASFDGVNNHINATYASGLSGSFTISGWINGTSFPAFPNLRLMAGSEVASYNNYWISVGTQGSNAFGIALFDGTNNPFVSETVTAGAWQHVAGVRSTGADTIQAFVNAASANGAVSDTTTSTPTYSDFNIGRQQVGTVHVPFLGTMDEIRVMNTPVTTSWLTADYNSQKASSTFITWGARTAVPTGGGPLTYGGELTHGSLIRGGRLAS